MVERDVKYIAATSQTQSSSSLDMNSFVPLNIPLEQDFDLMRVARGIDSVTLSASYFDYPETLINTDDGSIVNIFNSVGELVQSLSENQISTGVYESSFTPPASSTPGIYEAVHSGTVTGSAISVSEFFKVVTAKPGSYFNQYVRGRDTFQAEAVMTDSVGNPVDVDGLVTASVTSSTGVLLIENALATSVGNGRYSYRYSPGHNDPVGVYRMVFSGIVAGEQIFKQIFFEVVSQKGELIIGAEEYRNSAFGARLDLSEWTNEQIDDAIYDAQSMAENYIGYKLFSRVISKERHAVNIDKYGRLALRLNSKPIVKLIKVTLRYHPTQSLYDLPINGFEIDHEDGLIYYVYSSAYPESETIDAIAIETSFSPSYDALIDYESGLPEVNGDIKLAIKILATGIISGEIAGSSLERVKSLKSSEYQETYHNDTARDSSVGAYTSMERRAYDLLHKGGYTFPGIV